jgi:hypothetical protein
VTSCFTSCLPRQVVLVVLKPLLALVAVAVAGVPLAGVPLVESCSSCSIAPVSACRTLLGDESELLPRPLSLAGRLWCGVLCDSTVSGEEREFRDHTSKTRQRLRRSSKSRWSNTCCECCQRGLQVWRASSVVIVLHALSSVSFVQDSSCPRRATATLQPRPHYLYTRLCVCVCACVCVCVCVLCV